MEMIREENTFEPIFLAEFNYNLPKCQIDIKDEVGILNWGHSTAKFEQFA